MSTGKGTTKLRIVHLEDNRNDVVLVREALDSEGLSVEVTNVATRQAFIDALGAGPIDLILADYSLPSFDGLSALTLARELVPGVPFILLSGTLGEDAAIESLHNGATDYVLKHRLTRLAPAVRRALEEASERATRRTVEEALEHERRFLRSVLDRLDAGVLACDPEGVPTLWNPPVRAMYGLPDGPLTAEDWKTCARLYEADRKTPVEPEQAPLARALRGELLRNVELTIRQRSGAERTVLVSGHAILDALGQKYGAVVALQDITEQKRLEAQFRQAQKMEAMGRLAAGVAHDFNNLLTVIAGHCDLLRRRASHGGVPPADLDAIDKASQRAARLTRQLLAFSRQQILEPRNLDLNGVIAEMQKMLTRVIGEDIELVFQPGDELARVRADAGQVEQILMNLIVNSQDAMTETGGAITIETSNLASEKSPGEGFVQLTVSDSGCGMDTETQARIFEPFYTTKGAGKGTGLGLSTVHGIVTQSGGTIAVKSEVGRGTTFTIRLPAAVGPEEVARPPAAPAAPSGGAETVLVVDDDEALRGVVGDILQLSGYTVKEASSAEAALALIEKEGRSIDAMITDVMMPKLSGSQLKERVSALRPNLPTLYMSGYAGESIETISADLRAGVGFIQKPFTPEALVRKLREVLDSPIRPCSTMEAVRK